MQGIKTQREYNHKEPRKQRELAFQPTPGSSLLTSAINTTWFSLSLLFSLAIAFLFFFHFISTLVVGPAAYLEGLLLCRCLVGPSHHPYISL